MSSLPNLQTKSYNWDNPIQKKIMKLNPQPAKY
jgi:hypothetical protein